VTCVGYFVTTARAKSQVEEAMRKLIEYIAQSLVDNPSAVQVREVRNDRHALVLELHVAQEDFGKVIGRQGRVAKAMRTLLRAIGTREGRHTALDIV
jgi:predicted RNA-binding protein YlqC (UPF0109 family)